MKIVFLLNNAYGIGGTIRSVANLSAGLAARGHTVAVTSLYRHRDTTSFAFDPRVPIETLIDQRDGSPDAEAPAAGKPSELLPAWQDGVSLLSDQRMRQHLADLTADVVVATRPTLSVYLGHWGQRRYLRLGQEHAPLATRPPEGQALRLAAVPRLDAFTPVSQADAVAYRQALPEAGTVIERLPNCSPLPHTAPATGDSRTIVAAGRLVETKRYDRLIDAFALLTDEFPDWRLRVYGRGPARPALRARIEERGLSDRARLMGAVSPIETEWAKGAVAAVTSQWESFGLTIVEAMACGVPVLSTDCPHGPAELITHRHDGYLVPHDDDPVPEIAAGLRTLLKDEALRRRLADNALATARRYSPDVIAAQFEDLVARLAPRPRGLARLRGLFGGRSGEPAGAAGAGSATEAAPEPPRPAAHATAAGDGGLAVALDTPARGELLFRLRKDPRRRTVRVPLDRHGRATLRRADHQLAEGRWDAFLDAGDGTKPVRIAARLVETAALVHAAPLATARGVTGWIPYPTKDGNLTLRVWQRAQHAEVTEIRSTAGAATLTVVSVPPVADAGVVARDQAGRERPLTVSPGPGTAAGAGGALLATLDCQGLHPGTWTLHLTTPEGQPDAPLARIAGDTADRRKTDVQPTHAGPDGGSHRLVFNGANELTVSVTSADGAEQPG
ncbi:glycosyltransferase family 4 protein [Streptomyces sp. DSM 44915]|uniref:D-inositol 3-phosphate glycosyltransferase n=1 Tax=Streptomyces chisholmiae TaxID=3075540 RepID=A0ABU2JNN9_9ACTN|nr:glycosyltransferase family 4 protein [Streptomyces sp. DSM 44915]MDT0265853.1 glycosyltransferase family 4 protein [Streptomyces sp. DSM 44915]